MSRVVVLNGAPRSGKSEIARALIGLRSDRWVNLGVDETLAALPPGGYPGIGLRPGGEHPELEAAVEAGYVELWKRVRASWSDDIGVVVDVGLHRSYVAELDPWHLLRAGLDGVSTLIVGVHCSLEEILRRRRATGYPASSDSEPVPEPILAWQDEVHRDTAYDLVVDSTLRSAADIAAEISSAVDR